MQYRILVILLLCILIQYSQANPNWSFRHLESKEGMSLIKSIVKDNEGFLWIGNDGPGLMRYDGYNTQRFLFNPNDSSSISSNKIFQIFLDSNNHLWIATYNGLNLYIPRKESFKRYLTRNTTTDKSDHLSVNCIFEDHNKQLWVGTDEGLKEFIEFKQTFKLHPLPQKQELAKGVTSIQEDTDHNLWIATYLPGIFYFNPVTREKVYYPHPNRALSKDTKKIYIDQSGLIWILSRENGLSYFNPETKSFVDFPVGTNGFGLNGKKVMGVYEPDSIHLYFAVDQGGINMLNKQTMRFEYINHRKIGLDTYGIYCFYPDKDGTLWIGTARGGVSYYNPQLPVFRSHTKNNFEYPDNTPVLDNLSGNIIGCFYEDAMGNIWVGTDGEGISIFNPKNDLFLNIKNKKGKRQVLPSNVIRSIVADSENNLWLATWNSGISKYNKSTKKFDKWPTSDNSFHEKIPINIWTIYIDSKNILWMGFEDAKILRYDINNKQLDEYKYIHPIDQMSLPYFYETNSGNIMLTNTTGVYKINEYNHTIEDFILVNGVTSFATDKKENYWIGTSTQGVYVYNNQLEKKKHFSTSNLLADNSISAIMCSNDSNIWISTSVGLYNYQSSKDILLSYFRDDGLQGDQFFIQSAYKTSNGELYFGGTRGFTHFNPKQVKQNNEKPRVIINSISIDNAPLTFKGQDADITVHPRYLQTLKVNYNHSVINIGFNALTFTAPNKCRYKYRLKGFSSQWTETSADNRKATFTNINPGKYTFEVVASNNDGVWSNRINTLNIIIPPPFWQTNWFITLIICMIIASIRLYIFLREKKLRKDSNQLRQAVNDRTKIIEDQKEELQTQNEELQTHRQNLEELVVIRTEELILAKDKAEEGNRLKSAFLANMSHEIRTPMNAIVGFSDLIADNDLSEEERKAYSELIKTNTDALLILIEDILDISKIEANQLPIFKSEFNINESINTLYNNFLVQIRNPKISLRINNTIRDTVTLIKADQHRINQIISNFLNNAVKFTDSGDIILATEITDSHLIISVEDSGPGLDSKEMEIIFIPFFKLPKDERNLKRGVGLGLAISKQLSILMGYQIQVSSELGKGSKFSLLIPKQEILETAKKRMPSF
nr:two-component regulator propeller domain-containing protein [uncultured Carboxylicivirga sp.]